MMEEGSAAGGGGGESELGKAAAATSYVSGGGGRQRFEVELRPGETTIVSWKKLVKDANRVKVPPPPPVPAVELSAIAAAAPPPLPVSNVVPPPPGQMAEDEANDVPPASRFSAVIEKIERLYMGKNSSDEEDLNDIPDDDEYDTEDSFIDDAELDEYFQVDNSAVKHDGFFVNRGKLERIEPTLVPSEQPKKRRRKDLAKSNGGSDDRHISNKQMKVNRKAAEGLVPSVDKNTSPSHFIPTTTVRIEDVKHQIQVSTSEACSSKKSADAKTSGEPSPSRGSNGEAITMIKYNDKQKSGIVQSKNHDSKMKDGTDAIAASSLRTSDKSSFMQPKSQSGRLPNNVEDLSQSVQRKEKNLIRERSDIKVPENSLQTVKNPVVARKEGSNVKSKSTMLEKAIRELEKIVAESRPPSMDIPDADMSSQAVKRRMPPEIKQKLAKVARLAQTSNGKISKELLNRLMSIVGHLIQLRTLKRNLKIMVNTGASALEEKDARLRQLKKDVDEMVKMRVPLMKSKATEQQAGASDDFQETSMKEREGIKKRCSMDDALEDKICDIYDVFVDGLDEDAAPQVRKLYAELAELWPKGFMDNRGIKNAICRSKERKKSQYNRHKDQEKMKRKKLLTQNTEGTTQLEVGSSAQQQYIPEKLVNIDSANNGSSSVNRPVPSTQEVTNAATKMPVPSVNGPNIDRPKQEKVKAISNNPADNKMTEVPIKKKVKRKPEAQLGEAAHTRTDKLAPAQGGEKHKSSKPATTTVHKIPQPVTVALPTQPPHLNTSASLL